MPIVELQIALIVDQPRVHRRRIAEHRDLFGELIDDALEQAQRAQRDRLRLRQRGKDAIPPGNFQRRVDTPGHRPRWMHAFARQPFDHLLPELPQPNAVPSKLRMILDQPDDVAPRRIAVEPKQQIGRREMEEAQRMRLDHLAAMHDLAQFRRRRRHAHAHDRLARL